MMPSVRILLHLDLTDDGRVVWWADSPDVPGLSAAADHLRDVQFLAHEAVHEAGFTTANLNYVLMDVGPSSASDFTVTETPDAVSSAGSAVEATRADSLLVHA